MSGAEWNTPLNETINYKILTMLMFSLPSTDELLTAVDFNEVGGGDLVRDVRNQFRGASTLSRGG